MCGFSGVVSCSSASAHKEALLKSLKNIQHRGPDDSGVITGNNFGLAHARLSIIDPASSKQPMSSSSHHIVFNGEIYNYIQLKKELSELGITFSTDGDTEVVLKGLMQEGVKFLPRLEGCYSLAYLNEENQEILLARDPMGINPLFVLEQEDSIFFSSELHGLIPFNASFTWDMEGISDYFKYSYCQSPSSSLSNIKSVNPGQAVLYRFGSETIDKSTSKKINFFPSRVDNLELALESAVEKRLLDDVPVGTFLSGGLDSSLISAIASKLKPGLKTFSVGFENAGYDESNYAEKVAEHIKSDHTTFKMDMNQLIVAAKEFPRNIDQPFGDSSALAMGMLCKNTSQQVKVALSGDGADELFAGYNKHRVFDFMQKPVKKIIPGPSLTKFLPGLSAQMIKRINRMHGLKKLKSSEVYDSLRAWVDDDLLSRWISPFSPSSPPAVNHFREQLTEDQDRVLLNDMLVKVDRMSMLYGLEVRVPYLDSQVVSHSRALTQNELMRKGETKLPLRNIAKNWLPQEILTRPKKGFEIPLHELMRHGLKEEMEELLSHSTEEFLNIHAIKKDWEAFLQKKIDNPYAFWFVYVLLSWKLHHH